MTETTQTQTPDNAAPTIIAALCAGSIELALVAGMLDASGGGEP